MENRVIPTQAGQVCKTLVSLENEKLDDVYILTVDPSLFQDNEAVEIVKLKDLQRNLHDPLKAERREVLKSNLTVVGSDLQQYIAGWNN